MRIGLVLSVLDEEYQISVYEGIRKKTQELGFELICFQVENADLRTDRIISNIAKKSLFAVDCVILLTSVITDNYEIKTREDVKKIWGDIPVISIGQKVSGIPCLLVETEKSIKELTEHLAVEHGYRNFLYIGGDASHQDAITREKVFTETLDKLQEKYADLTYTVKDALFTEETAVSAVQEYFQETPGANPDAIICANDNMAIGVYKFFKVNQDNPLIKECAVTGFDDIPQSRFSIPSITTIRQPITALGERAVYEVQDIANGKPVPQEVFEDSVVLYRESCGCKKDSGSSFVRQLQKSYVHSENLMRLVSRIGQNMNYAQEEEGIRAVLDQWIGQLEAKTFAVLAFEGLSPKEKEITVRPVYVSGDLQEDDSLTGENADGRSSGYGKERVRVGKTVTLGDFYSRLGKTPLIFKYLYSGDDVVGCLLFDAPASVLPYIESIAVNIAQALERVKMLEARRLYAERLEKDVALRTKQVLEEERRRLAVEANVLKISEMERQRFSNDLHDDICQRLAGISMLCRSYSERENSVSKEEMRELSQLIGETLQTTRQYAHNSYPVELERLGLNKALVNLCTSFERQTGLLCACSWQLPENMTFSEAQSLNIFRIIQEALHNAAKHSNAKNVSVTLKEKSGKVTVEICDDGKGFSPNPENKGLGLDSMQYRANQIDAQFSIRPLLPHGTCISCEFHAEQKQNSQPKSH